MASYERLVEEAYARLFPGEELSRVVKVRFSSRFNPYNASVRSSSRELEMRLSRAWEGVNREILIGLFQELLLKVFSRRKGLLERKESTNIMLYHHFLQSLHLAAEEQEEVDPRLEEAFERVNRRFFSGVMERPRLRFGQPSPRTLGNYHYASDTVTLSALLADDPELLDYVLFHELLHKDLKYRHGKAGTRYHTAEFRRREAAYPDRKRLERRLSRLVSEKGERGGPPGRGKKRRSILRQLLG